MKEVYSADGYRIVKEVDQCSLWEEDTAPCYVCSVKDCFFCKYADFRKGYYIDSVKKQPATEILYGICRNEMNRKRG